MPRNDNGNFDNINERYGSGRRPPRQRIDFDEELPAPGRRDPYAPGQDDRDWSDEFETRSRGRVPLPENSRRNGGNRTEYDYRARVRQSERVTEEYDDDYREPRRRPSSSRKNNDPMNDNRDERPAGFARRHPILMNLLYIILTGVVLVWVAMWFLDFWTFHGQERTVPDLRGQEFVTAEGNAGLSGLRAEVADSVFDTSVRPGTVIEQVPVPGSRIKKGGTVYVTVVAFSTKLVTVPDFYNVSVRQARSMFEGIGIKEIQQIQVVSEYPGLVLGARYNGVALQPGAKIPVSAVVTLEVGTGFDPSIADYPVDSIAPEDLLLDEMIEELNID